MKTKVNVLFAAAVLSCLLLTGCVSPAKIMTYREENAAFVLDISFGGLLCRADVALPKGGAASLVFKEPSEAEGLAVSFDGDMLYIGDGTRVPVKAENVGGTLPSLLKLLSSSPSDVHTAIRCELDGIPVYRCETERGDIYVAAESGRPVRFVTDGAVADVVG